MMVSADGWYNGKTMLRPRTDTNRAMSRDTLRDVEVPIPLHRVEMVPVDPGGEFLTIDLMGFDRI